MRLRFGKLSKMFLGSSEFDIGLRRAASVSVF
jgi:hypothetical protein